MKTLQDCRYIIRDDEYAHITLYETSYFVKHQSNWNNFKEWDEDIINELKEENPNADYSWFIGNGYYCLDDNKDIFKNDGAIIYYFEN